MAKEAFNPFERASTVKELKKRPLKKLIRPTKRVVEIAMDFVQYREVDNYHAQKAVVRDPRSRHTYQIVNLLIPKFADTQNQGLYINPVEITPNGRTIHTGPNIQIPRSPDVINTTTIYRLHGLSKRTMKRLARELHRAEVIR